MSTPSKATKSFLLCKNFLSKEMAYEPFNDEEDESASGIYCCSKTYENFGPDGAAVDRKVCCPGRGCYKPPF